MCLTIVGQIVYGGLLLGALALTLGAIFTPRKTCEFFNNAGDYVHTYLVVV